MEEEFCSDCSVTIAECKRLEQEVERLRGLLRKAELALCTCPWPSDAVATRHIMGCPCIDLDIDRIGIAKQALSECLRG